MSDIIMLLAYWLKQDLDPEKNRHIVSAIGPGLHILLIWLH